VSDRGSGTGFGESPELFEIRGMKAVRDSPVKNEQDGVASKENNSHHNSTGRKKRMISYEGKKGVGKTEHYLTPQ